MSQKAIKKVSFIAKAPNDRNDFSRILDLACRISDRASGKRDESPSNIIAFPVKVG